MQVFPLCLLDPCGHRQRIQLSVQIVPAFDVVNQPMVRRQNRHCEPCFNGTRRDTERRLAAERSWRNPRPGLYTSGTAPRCPVIHNRDSGYSLLSFWISGFGRIRRIVVCPVLSRSTANRRTASSARSSPSNTAGLWAVKMSCRSTLDTCSHFGSRETTRCLIRIIDRDSLWRKRR